MDILKASDAKELVKKAKKSNMNHQRDYVLRAIKYSANKGDNYLVIDFGNIILFDDDYKYFESLGYTIKWPEKYIDHNGIMWQNFGIISW